MLHVGQPSSPKKPSYLSRSMQSQPAAPPPPYHAAIPDVQDTRAWATSSRAYGRPPTPRPRTISLLDMPQHIITSGSDELDFPASPVSPSSPSLPSPEIVDADRREVESLAQATFDCSICMDQHPIDEIIIVEPCGHAYCLSGLKGHIGARLSEGAFPVLCPNCQTDGENTPIGNAVAQMVGLTEQQFTIWTTRENMPWAADASCPRCRNNFLVDRADFNTATQLTCPFPRCAVRWCKTCSSIINNNSATPHVCQPMTATETANNTTTKGKVSWFRTIMLKAKSRSRGDGTKELEKLIRTQRWKRCPGCQVPVERIAGCSHMTCRAPGCSAHFCYTCGGTLSRYVSPTSPAALKSAPRCRC